MELAEFPRHLEHLPRPMEHLSQPYQAAQPLHYQTDLHQTYHLDRDLIVRMQGNFTYLYIMLLLFLSCHAYVMGNPKLHLRWPDAQYLFHLQHSLQPWFLIQKEKEMLHTYFVQLRSIIFCSELA